MFDNLRAANDLFNCPVGVEALYPTDNDHYLLSTWEEYALLLSAELPFAIDLSHVNILAEKSGRMEQTLIEVLLSSSHCIEVHLSDNDGDADSHRKVEREPWWWPLLARATDFAAPEDHGSLLREAELNSQALQYLLLEDGRLFHEQAFGLAGLMEFVLGVRYCKSTSRLRHLDGEIEIFQLS